MILKIQLPLSGNTEHEPLALIYGKDREFKFMPVTDDLKSLMGEDIKAFFEGEFVEQGEKLQLAIKHRVEDPGW